MAGVSNTIPTELQWDISEKASLEMETEVFIIKKNICVL